MQLQTGLDVAKGNALELYNPTVSQSDSLCKGSLYWMHACGYADVHGGIHTTTASSSCCPGWRSGLDGQGGDPATTRSWTGRCRAAALCTSCQTTCQWPSPTKLHSFPACHRQAGWWFQSPSSCSGWGCLSCRPTCPLQPCRWGPARSRPLSRCSCACSRRGHRSPPHSGACWACRPERCSFRWPRGMSWSPKMPESILGEFWCLSDKLRGYHMNRIKRQKENLV